MSDTIVSAWHKLSHLILTTTPRVGIIFIPILWMRKLRHKEVKELAQDPTGGSVVKQKWTDPTTSDDRR